MSEQVTGTEGAAAETSAAGELFTLGGDNDVRLYPHDQRDAWAYLVRLQNPAMASTFVDLANAEVKRLVDASLAALREQVERNRESAKNAIEGITETFSTVTAGLKQQLASAQAALKQKDELIDECIHLLDDDHVEKNTFRLGAIGASILGDIYVELGKARQIQPDSSALKAVIEAETVKLRDAAKFARAILSKAYDAGGVLMLNTARQCIEQLDSALAATRSRATGQKAYEVSSL